MELGKLKNVNDEDFNEALNYLKQQGITAKYFSTQYDYGQAFDRYKGVLSNEMGGLVIFFGLQSLRNLSYFYITKRLHCSEFIPDDLFVNFVEYDDSLISIGPNLIQSIKSVYEDVVIFNYDPEWDKSTNIANLVQKSILYERLVLLATPLTKENFNQKANNLLKSYVKNYLIAGVSD